MIQASIDCTGDVHLENQERGCQQSSQYVREH